MARFALVDCNNFYASCEKLFDPALVRVPLVVLSNNDGCIIARSAEAKALGVPMGAPWFQVRDDLRRLGVRTFSSNYPLYADMSNRVVQLLRDFAPDLEVYSIDESFLRLETLEELSWLQWGQRLRQRVVDWLGLPVCVGIAATKTLAKLANHCAKQRLAGERGVCDFGALAPRDLSRLLAGIEVGEVWGIGRRLGPRLAALGIHTVEDLRRADPVSLGRRFSVVQERIIRELRGTACLELEEVMEARQQIMCSRSFGRYLHEREPLEAALASHVSRAAEKLRAQASLAGSLTVQLRALPRGRGELPRRQSLAAPLPQPSDDTRLLVQWGLDLLRRLYEPGFAYQKAGCLLAELTPRDSRQGDLFAPPGQTGKGARLMETLDAVNRRWGRDTLRLAVGCGDTRWHMRQEHLSPRYTTAWEDLPVVLAR